ncbi:DUF3455 domain-containing protein [Marinomonas sp. IMCC 4694]|uniref:DUF3455 domain-containing protein n=1 Tax=Marinomonas sp. IMCC 4694 TaxID=2605432 RepID=UPI0011E80342|nr:DUF3455 domain-containing protein [Marinomonas sp. IMCC 4694]TYL47454.1 DUF3455 domain-containing protein [Marinomonas sp. IMCC 4694]
MSNKMMFKSLQIAAVSALMITSVQSHAWTFSQDNLPASVQVPAGNKVAMFTSAVGNITWECKADSKNMDQASWAFAGPRAILSDNKGNHLVSYFGPPATWESIDGSSITGKQLAVSPSEKGSIPMQLVKANTSSRPGVLEGVTYVQRINLKGGAAPETGCNMDKIGHKVVVNYSGEYLFWKAK